MHNLNLLHLDCRVVRHSRTPRNDTLCESQMQQVIASEYNEAKQSKTKYFWYILNIYLKKQNENKI